MHFSTLSVFCGLVAAAAAATTTTATTTTKKCNADNCLRAIEASAFPSRHGTADCSSFFETTVTPATATITATATATAFSNKRRRALNAEPALEARQMTVVPSAIPTYASACSGSVRYSSACSCIGVTATTSTASTPMTTVTVTVTASETKPTVAFTGFYGQSCDTGTENGDDGSFIEGECMSLPDEISIDEDGFSAGTSTGLTAADCTITFYSDGACTQEEHSAPATPGCQFVGFDFSGLMTCAM